MLFRKIAVGIMTAGAITWEVWFRGVAGAGVSWLLFSKQPHDIAAPIAAQDAAISPQQHPP